MHAPPKECQTHDSYQDDRVVWLFVSERSSSNVVISLTVHQINRNRICEWPAEPDIEKDYQDTGDDVDQIASHPTHPKRSRRYRSPSRQDVRKDGQEVGESCEGDKGADQDGEGCRGAKLDRAKACGEKRYENRGLGLDRTSLR